MKSNFKVPDLGIIKMDISKKIRDLGPSFVKLPTLIKYPISLMILLSKYTETPNTRRNLTFVTKV